MALATPRQDRQGTCIERDSDTLLINAISDFPLLKNHLHEQLQPLRGPTGRS